MSFAISGVVCIAVLAFVGPIVLFVSGILIHRRIQLERQKSSIYRIKGLDPPLGTRDPALLWPSVLATPAATADRASTLTVARSGSLADDDDSHIARRPASVASNHSSTNSAGSTQQSSPTSGRSARHGISPLFRGLTAPPAAVVAGCSQEGNLQQQANTSDKPYIGASSNSTSSSRSRSSGDCRINIHDIQHCRDQTRAAAAAALSSAVGAVSGNATARLKRCSTDQQPHKATNDVVRHWGSPRGHRSHTGFGCHTLDRHDVAHRCVDTVRQQPVACV